MQKLAVGRATSLWGSQAYTEVSAAPCLPVQGGSFRAHMPDLDTDSGTFTLPSSIDSTDLDADIVGEEVRQAKAIIASRSFFRKG